jgi:ArsR family transcriptional regulator
LATTTYSSRTEVLRDELNQLFGSQERNIDQATRSLKVLAHPARLKILCALRTGEQTVQDLEYCTGLKQTTLSQHLSLLRSRDIVTSRREANFSFYRIANDRTLELFELIKDIYCQT